MLSIVTQVRQPVELHAGRRRRNWRQFLRSKWLLLGVTTGITTVVMFFAASIHDFLAVNNPVGEGILVVEAWIPPRALAESANLFNSRQYRYFVVVGGPIRGMDTRFTHPTTYDDLAAQRLEKLGFDTSKLVRISVPAVPVGDRTLACAMAVRRWLSNSGISVCCVEVFTMGVHARKSWILFRQALGDRYRVGIIAGPVASYDPRFWFFSTSGIRTVMRNVAGYLYSEFLVHLLEKNIAVVPA